MDLDDSKAFTVEEVHAMRVVSSDVLNALMDKAFDEENAYLEEGLMCDPDDPSTDATRGILIHILSTSYKVQYSVLTRSTLSGPSYNKIVADISSQPANTSEPRNPYSLPSAGSIFPSLKKRKASPISDEQHPPNKLRNFANERRKRRRLVDKITVGHQVTLKVRTKLLKITEALPIDLQVFKIYPATFGGYQGLDWRCPQRYRGRTLDDLIEKEKFTYIAWDGTLLTSPFADHDSNISSRSGKTPRPLIDTEGVVFGVLAGRPNDDQWLRASERLYEAMSSEASNANFADESQHHPKILHHGRGDFPAINAGITPGQGSKFPHMVNLGIYEDMIERLIKNKDLQYLADWHNWCVKAWWPDLYYRLRSCLDKLHSHPTYGEGLERITPAGIYPAAAFNFGPNVATDPHRDVKNFAFGLCSIQPVGPFNPDAGGHIFFDDLKLIVRFPSGSVILIPSATLTYANIRVAEGDERASFTQYFPAGILRFVENGFRTEKSIKARSKKAELELHEKKSKGSVIGMRLWKKLSDLVDIQE
ncbi:hypothetical protein NP233_g2316 [Leucocoprinus birnbaumii]|uniref:Uncharacterized protein n=1 Tax=Leucocoprinus birnbaumii TaxID=56174 RepID=A0AAD5YTY9_9AGAR|nr:hypothetical protein NP233_g2316 [Leucocoprinus birnbaumii]